MRNLFILINLFVFSSSHGQNLCVQELINQGILKDPFVATLENNNQFTSITARNIFFTASPLAVRPSLQRIAEVLLRRTPVQQTSINASLRSSLARYGNSFKKPVGNGYEFFVPEVQGMVLPIEESKLKTLIHSTTPVLLELKRILQSFYSQTHPTAESLGIQSYSVENQQTLLKLIKKSPYFEPKAIHTSLRHYPFLPVTGFDAAVSDWDNVTPTFFEMNLKTPSGLTNNLQLLEALRINDVELFRTFKDHLVDDHTFSNLRQVIEMSSSAWTQNNNGICVIISPGPHNAAHPDVSYISRFTGMPLVSPQDLYQDTEGFIRIYKGLGASDPLVRGIYNRMDDTYLLNAPTYDIPARDSIAAPKYNSAVMARTNLLLDPHILYDYQFDPHGNITDVSRGTNGAPQFQTIFDRLILNPYVVNPPQPNLLNSLLQRKIYISNFGGGILDDKRIFALVSEELSRRHPMVAHPPRTYSIEEVRQKINAREEKDLVIKSPDRSGGSQIYILANLADSARYEIIHQYLSAPEEYTVQQFSPPALLLAPEKKGDTATQFGTRLSDLRTFMFMDSTGRVSSGPNGILLRVAKANSALSNTSLGGEYGIGVAISREINFRDESISLLPNPEKTFSLSLNRISDVRHFLSHLAELIKVTSNSYIFPHTLEKYLEDSIWSLRKVMDLMGWAVNPLMEDLKKFQNKKLSQRDLHEHLLLYKQNLLNDTGSDAAVLSLSQEYLGEGFPFATTNIENNRSNLLTYFKANGFPLMMKDTSQGEIPVVLVNSANVTMLRKFFQNTVGIQTEHQPTNQYDHGNIRIGNIVMDRDTPGRRAMGEINQTGISWLSVFDIVSFKSERALTERQNKRIELTYFLTQSEIDKASYYQIIRRIGIINAPYWIGSSSSTNVSASENCFTFSKGSATAAIVNELKSKLISLNFSPQRIQEPQIREILDSVKKQILNWPLALGSTEEANLFSWNEILNIKIHNSPILEKLHRFSGSSNSSETLKTLIALDASQQYLEFLNNQSISGGIHFGADLYSGKASAVLIYDWDINAFSKFSDATFNSRGKTGTWFSDNQRAVRY